MIEEHYENTDIPTEELAQYMYENKRLKDELTSLRRNSFGIEENLNMLSVDIQKKDSSLKRSEQQLMSMIQAIQEKDHLIGVMDRKLDQMMDENKNLATNLTLLKDEKDRLNEENEVLREKERELTEKQSEIEMTTYDLKAKIECLSRENSASATLLNELHQQVKVLEDEKISLQERIEVLKETRENRSPSRISPSSFFGGYSFNFSPMRRCLDFSPEKVANTHVLDDEVIQLNLREELLLAEINEKQNKINSLEEKLQSSENTLHQMSVLIRERLKDAIDVIIDSWNNANEDFEIIFPPLKPYFEKLMDTLGNWSDGQSGENNPLTEAPDSVKVKEAVINAQPVPNRTVESISIATQTDRILLAKALEEFSPIQNVLDHKYSDVDMDLYRSYRKLSILPEEEDDETFKRIPSLKNAINSKSFSAKLPQSYKIHSADDILNFEKRIDDSPANEKLISSCTNIILSSRERILNDSVGQSDFVQGSPECRNKSGGKFLLICDNKLSDNCNFKSEKCSVSNSSETRNASLDPLEVFRQPHSFDSYLDPQQIQITSLPRQISDPTQNTVCDLPLTRRGSYLKRPRSTCRPLRLPCEENNAKQEERVSKVRFDLSNNENSKSSDNMNGSKGPVPASNLKNHRKIERISRFTVEKIDEDEFRKSIDESNKIANHKRPPLVHSVVYKKSVLQDMAVYDSENNSVTSESLSSRINVTGSPDSPSYETATENSPVDSFDMANYESNYLIADIYPCKRRKQSDSSSYSMESQDSIDGNDILIKSIKLHSNSEHITMKELDRESSTSSHLSMDMDIPYIDAEELPVVKQSPDVIGVREGDEDKDQIENVENDRTSGFTESSLPKTESPIKQSESSETFLTANSDVTPTTDMSEGGLSPPKSSGLSKSPTVLKNLANFELYNTVSESLAGLNQSKKSSTSVRNQIVEEEDEESDLNENGDVKAEEDRDDEEEESTILKLTSSDVSDISDTVTYVTVKSDPSNVILNSDYDSDTYVTIQSDKSTLERKFSDFSENSSSPYNTPPDTSSASFCTPPDTYSPILTRLAKHFGASFEADSPRGQTGSSSPLKDFDLIGHSGRADHPQISSNAPGKYETPSMSPFSSPPCSPPFSKSCHQIYHQDSLPESESVTIYNIDDMNFPCETDNVREKKDLIMFDSPKLEFYETNDSIENLEAFLKTEEGLQELVKTPVVSDRSWRISTLEDLQEEPGIEGGERKNSDAEEGSLRESLSKNNSLDGAGVGDSKFFEKRGKRHPPLSRQNSTEEYNFLEPHDSCLNLSEEISSPSTTPDTSNKTVIFKNKPLTVSNTIDLDDDDFPISESEIQINFNGSETEIVEIAIGESSTSNERYDIYSCRSEPCIPSISSSTELPTIVRLPKQSSSMSDDQPVEAGKFDGTALPMPPEIIVSNLSSESENDSDAPGGILIDFASNASERSEINLSDLNSLSAQSENAYSNSEPSDNIGSERSAELQITDPELSLSVSPEVSENSSSSSPHPHSAELEMDLSDHPISSDADVSHITESNQQLYVAIPEHLTEEGIDNSTITDLPDGTSEICSHNICEASPCRTLVFQCFYTWRMMSSQNNSPKEDQDLHKSSEACTTSTSSIDNSNNEHRTIHGNEISKEIENESSQNHVNENHEQLVAVQSEAEMETPVLDRVNEDIYNIDAALDIDGNTTLSEEEVEKKFQELRLAFRTDAMTLPKRLIIRKRLRDQAELNVEKEINLMKSQLNNLRYLCFDSESLEQLSDLKKHLDVLLASANYLSGSAEAFGFVQNEEKMSGAVAIILRQIESIERIQSEMSKSSDLDKSDGKRIQLLPILDDERQEDRVVRRRSVAALALNGPAKRRASIASVPRNPLPTDEINGSQYSSSPSIFSSRTTATVTKKVSSSQSSTPKSISPLVAGDQMHVRLRKESRMGDYGMKFVQDYENGLGMDDQSDDLLLSSDEEASIEDKGNSQLAVLRMSASLDNRIRKNSVASETLNIIDSLRNVVKWNVLLIRNSRFQFPENVHQYVPFLITWYVVILIVAVFTSGFFTGFNRCFSSQTLYSYSLVSCIVTFWITVLNVVLRWKPTKYLVVTAVLMCAHNLHHTLHDGGIDGVFKRLGIQIETHYTQGAPI